MKNIKSTAIILAGGESIRLKKTLEKQNLQNAGKPFLKINKNFMIEEIIKKIKSIFEEILVVTSDKKIKYFENMFDLNGKKVKIIKDLIPYKNSIGGIYSGLVRTKNLINFIIGSDMPFIQIDLIKFMLNEAIRLKRDVIIPRIKNTMQPLFAVYTKNCIQVIKNQIENKNFKIIDILKKLNFFILNEKLIKKYDYNYLSFFNINTDYDYKKAIELLKDGILDGK